LLLREYVEEDAEAFFRLNTDPEVLRFTGDAPLRSVDHARQILRDYPIADYRKYGFGRWACIHKATGEHLGFAGLKQIEELGEVEIGFRLMRVHWGLGFATEAAKAAVAYGLNSLALTSVIGLVVPENRASIRVLQKTGLEFSRCVDYRGRQLDRYVITS
jgi:RimJ/RimL family protein N-acetyltransferase